jgi:two-component system, OmpR family, response regulator
MISYSEAEQLTEARGMSSQKINNLKVAIVEDSVIIRRRLVELVEEIDGVEVVGEAATEQAAIELCLKTNPDAIILDMQLEIGNGLGVLKTMHYTTAQTKPLIIVLTNFPSPSVERAAIGLGATVFLDKSREFDKVGPLLKTAAGALLT